MRSSNYWHLWHYLTPQISTALGRLHCLEMICLCSLMRTLWVNHTLNFPLPSALLWKYARFSKSGPKMHKTDQLSMMEKSKCRGKMNWNTSKTHFSSWSQRGMHLHKSTSNLLSLGTDLSTWCTLKTFRNLCLNCQHTYICWWTVMTVHLVVSM